MRRALGGSSRAIGKAAVLVVSAAVLALVGVDNEISSSDAPAGASLVALGIMAAFFSLNHYERFRIHMEFAAVSRRIGAHRTRLAAIGC